MPRGARVRGPEMEGAFDWVKGIFRKIAPPAPGALIRRPPDEPQKRLPSMFEAFRPGQAPPPPSTLPSMFQAFGPPAAPREPSAGPLIFAAFKPTLPALPPETPAAPPRQDLTLWEALFDPATVAEAAQERPLSEMFAGPPPGVAPVAPVEPAPPEFPVERGLISPFSKPELRHYEPENWHREFPDIVERTQGRMPLWVAYNMGWSVPSTMEVSNQLVEHWDLMMIFENALATLRDPYWKRTVEESAHTGEPAVMEIEEIAGVGDPYHDLFSHLGVPEHVLDFYAAQSNAGELLAEEILEPMLNRVGKALEFLKPPPLKGWFVIGPSQEDYVIDEANTFWLKYKEAATPAQEA